MKKYLILLLMAIPLVMASCNDDEEELAPDEVPGEQKGPLEGRWTMAVIKFGICTESCFEFKDEDVTLTKGTYSPQWQCNELQKYKYIYNETTSTLTLIDKDSKATQCNVEWIKQGKKMTLYVGEECYMLTRTAYDSDFKIVDTWFGVAKLSNGTYERGQLNLYDNGQYEWKTACGAKKNEFGQIVFDGDYTVVEHKGSYTINNENHHLILYRNGSKNDAEEFILEWRNEYVMKLNRLYTNPVSYMFVRMD